MQNYRKAQLDNSDLYVILADEGAHTIVVSDRPIHEYVADWFIRVATGAPEKLLRLHPHLAGKIAAASVNKAP